MSNTVQVQILADVKNMVSGIDQTNKQLGGLTGQVGKATSAVGNMVKGFLAFQGVQMAVGFLKDSVQAASDLQQSVGAVSSVFGEYADNITKKSKEASQAYGISANDYNTSAALIGAVLKGQGVASDQLAGKVDDLVARGTDLAATFGGTTADAVSALGGAFKGEFDTLERYGISLKQSDINAELAARGQDKLTGASLKLATQQATNDLIMKQSAGSAGQFGRESESLAVKQQQLSARFEDTQAAIGQKLLPIMTNLATFANDTLLPMLSTFGQFLQDNAGWITPLAIAIGTIIGLVKAWTIAQGIFNAVMALNPFVLIIIGIAALVAGLIYAWKNSETFRNIVIGVFDAVVGFVKGAADFLVKLFLNWTLFGIIIKHWDSIKNATTTAWNAILNFFRAVPGAITGFFSAIGGWFANTWNSVKNGAVNGFTAMVNYIRGIPGAILGALGNLGNLLLGAGKAVIDGFINGIKNGFNAVKSTLGRLTGMLPDWKGPAEKDATILMGAGKLIISGLVKGLESQYGSVQKSLGGLTSDIAGTRFGSPSLSLAGGGGIGGGPTIIINAGVGTDPTELENAVVRALKGYSNKNGSGWINRL